VWCALVHLLVEEHQRGAPSPEPGADVATPLATLDFGSRLVVVLHSFAGLSTERVSAVIEQPLKELEMQLRSAELVLAERASSTEGDARG
jgi:hypothetical protein